MKSAALLALLTLSPASSLLADPIIGNLNGDSVSWPGVGGIVTLDAGGNGTAFDAGLGALNGGQGDWSGATLTVQRGGTAIPSDILGFHTAGALFTATGTSNGNLQSGGQIFAVFTNTGGVLGITFTGSGTTATTALVNDILRRITYLNDTPSGDATLRFTLSNGTTSSAANVDVSSDTIYITNTIDTASVNIADGISFSEAVAIALADTTGSQTLVVAPSLAGQTVSTSAGGTLGENLTLDLDSASGVTLAGVSLYLNSGSTLRVVNGDSDTATITTALDGGGHLTKDGPGSVTLSGNNTFSGTTTVLAGTLLLNGGTALLDNGAVAISGGTLNVASSETIGSLMGTSGAVVLATGSTLTVGGNNAGTTFSGDINGNGGLIKIGDGTLSLGGTNTYNGATTLSAGGINASGGAAIGNNSAVTVASGATLTVMDAETIGSLSGLGNVVLGATLTTGGNNTSTGFLGAISSTNSSGITKVGSGAFTLGSSNSYTGGTTLTAGTLAVQTNSALGTGPITFNGGTLGITTTSALTIPNNVNMTADGGIVFVDDAEAIFSGAFSGTGALTVTGVINGPREILTLTNTGNSTAWSGTMTATNAAIQFAADSMLGSGAITLNSGSVLLATASTTVDNDVVIGGPGIIFSNTGNLVISGVVSGSGALTTGGTTGTTVTLSGNNIHTGSLTVAAAKLILSGGSAVNDNSAVTISNSTTLELATSETIGSLAGSSGNTLILGANTLTTGGNNTTTTFAGTIGGNGGGLTKNGNGTQILSGSNTFTGGVQISSGTLTVSGGSTIGNTATVNVASDATFNLTSGETIGALSGAGTVQLNANTLTTGGSDLSTTFSGTITGGGNLTKNGTGTFTLGGSNGHTSNVAISGGTLQLDAHLQGSVFVNFGTTLSGNGGTVAGPLNVNSGGTISPGGADIGSLVVTETLQMAVGSTVIAQINGITAGTGYDQITVGGTLNLSGPTLAVTHGYSSGSGDSYTVLLNNGPSAIMNAFSGLAEGGTVTAGGNGTVLTASYIGGTGNDFTLTAPINAAPVVTLSGSTTTFIEGDNTASTPVIIDPGITVSDTDSATLSSATVLITGNFHPSQDGLSFINNPATMGNITASYNNGTGLLSLSSSGATATLAQWQATLRSITYTNSSENPNTANRTISFVINDGILDGNTATKIVTVTSVNDAPVNSVPGAQTVPQDGSLTFSSGNGNAISISDADAGNANVRVTLTATNGLINLGGTSNLTFLVGTGNGDATMTFEGIISHINSALSGLTFIPTPGYFGSSTLHIDTDDLGISGNGGAMTDTDTVTIQVIQSTPSVTSVSSPTPDGSHKIGDVIQIAVSFSTPVIVDTAGGTPTLLLETGAVDRTATYTSGSGTTTLIFSYIVQTGDSSSDLDYTSVSALSTNSGTIRNASNADAILTLPAPGTIDSLGANKALFIDGIAPAVLSVGVPNPYIFKNGENIDLAVTFSEPVTVTGFPTIAIHLDHGGPILAVFSSGSGSATLDFRATVGPNQADITGITVEPVIDLAGGTLRDTAGNNASLTLSNIADATQVLVDSSPPTVTAPIPDQTLVTGDPSVTINLNNHFADLGSTSLLFTPSNTDSAKATSAISGSILTLTPLANGTTTITVEASDLNGGTVTDAFLVTIGTSQPTALQLASTATFNNQTSLFEVTVNVTNTTPYPINGFRLNAGFSAYLAAHPSLRLYNATLTTAPGIAHVDHPFPVAVDATVSVKLAFYTSTRLFPDPFNPILTVETLAASQLPGTDGSGVQAQILNLPDQTKLIEFPAEIGKWYRVRYTSDFSNWHDSPVPLQAGSTRMQWIDSGPPFTDSPPSDASARFYTVTEIAAP